MNLSPPIRTRYLDRDGIPLSGGQLFTFAAGTSTPQATYSNQSGTPNTNPIVLDSQGYCDIWLNPTLYYKFILEDSLGNVQWTEDNVSCFDESLITSLSELVQYVPGSANDMFQGSTVQAALNFLNPYVSGTKASPTAVSGSAAIALIAGVVRQTWVIEGNGGAVTGVSLNTSSMQAGQRLLLVGGSNTNTVSIAEGASGTALSGNLVLGATSSGSTSTTCELEFDGTNWQEISRT